MNWPMSQDYNEAIQDSAHAFADVDLRTGNVSVGPMGVPLPRSGNFADVYHVRGADLRDWAVKCFTRPTVGLDVRYVKLSDALARARLPFTIEFSFLTEGIQVNGTWYPVVKMEWVEGLMLHQVVRENVDHPQLLAALAKLWVKLCRRLRKAGIAHADLQHANVIMVPGERPGTYDLKLIDYDGMVVPTLANTPTGETGHPAYQHPERTAKTYSSDLDRFPHLVVATAIEALEMAGQSLWERYDNGDNLLFTPQDFRDPPGSKLMRELWTTGNPGVRALVGRLAVACGRPIPQTPWLDKIAPRGVPIPLNPNETREAEAALGLSTSLLPTSLLSTPLLSTSVPISKPVVPVKPTKPQKPDKSNTVTAVLLEASPIVLVSPEKIAKPPVLMVSQPEESDREDIRSILLPLTVSGIFIFILILGGVLLLTESKPGDTPNGGSEVVVQNDSSSTPSKSTELSSQKNAPAMPLKPQESRPSPKQPEPKPKEPEVEFKPKESGPKPTDRVPIVKPPAILMPRWMASVETEGVPAKLYLESDAQIILVGNERTPLMTFDYVTGTKRPTSFAWFGLTGGNNFCPLDGCRVAKCLPDVAEILSWELKSGKTGEKFTVPKIAPGIGKATHICTNLSPDGRYLVVGRCDLSGSEYPTVPFRLFDNKSGKTLFSTDWTGGSTHFTAISSRLLIAEANGRFRWFKLPSGDPDAEWDFGLPIEGRRHLVTAISGNGSKIGYNGPTKNHTVSGPCLLNGDTGEVVHRFDKIYHENSPVALSEDGRRAALLQTFTEQETIVDVVTIPKGIAIARAKVPTRRNIPTFALVDRGDALLVHDAKSGKLWRFDLPPEITP